MKKHLIIVYSLYLILFSINVIYAQPKRNMDASKRVAELKEQLKLTDKQEVKIKKIFLDQQTQMTKMRNENSDGDRMAIFDKIMKLREETEEKIMVLLDKEQKILYKKILEERVQKFQNRGGGL